MKYKHKWIIQKISAIMFAVTLILTIINFRGIDIFQYSSVIVFFESKFNSLIILIKHAVTNNVPKTMTAITNMCTPDGTPSGALHCPGNAPRMNIMPFLFKLQLLLYLFLNTVSGQSILTYGRPVAIFIDQHVLTLNKLPSAEHEKAAAFV